MVRTVDAEHDRTIAMLVKLGQPEQRHRLIPQGVRAVGADDPRRSSSRSASQVEWIDMAAAHRAGHLRRAAPRADGRGKRLLLIGHLDTVFEADSPFQHWQPSKASGAHGPGAADDKGGDAVIVAALRAMQGAGTLRNADITVCLTGDEEDAGEPVEVARRDLIAAGKAADVALDFEGLIRDRAARTWARPPGGAPAAGRVDGNRQDRPIRAASSHPTVGYGAIYELARIIDAFRTRAAARTS